MQTPRNGLHARPNARYDLDISQVGNSSSMLFSGLDLDALKYFTKWGGQHSLQMLFSCWIGNAVVLRIPSWHSAYICRLVKGMLASHGFSFVLLEYVK